MILFIHILAALTMVKLVFFLLKNDIIYIKKIKFYNKIIIIWFKFNFNDNQTYKTPIYNEKEYH